MNELRTLGRLVACVSVVAALLLLGCGGKTSTPKGEEEEAIARTEFTDRIENFFEYEPLKAGSPSQFRIHLTDLSDGSPVEKADVQLRIKTANGTDVGTVKADVGKVDGIYVASVTIGSAGSYTIEFQIKNDKINEKMSLEEFEVK